MVGIYWIDDAGQRREPLLFQVATMRRRIAHLQDYRKREQALKGASSPA